MLKSNPLLPNAVKSKDPRFLAVNHNDIPCTVEQLRGRPKAIPIKFTILRPLCDGFGAAPYVAEAKDKKAMTNARKYSTMVFRDNQCSMVMYPYEKAEVLGDKGPLIDRPFELENGNTVTFFLDSKRLREDATRENPSLPRNTTLVPMFTLCELTIAPKSSQAEEKGSSFRIVMVRQASCSCYSVWSDIQHLPTTLQDARMRQLEHAGAFPNIHKDLETRDVPFRLHVSSSAQIEDTGVNGPCLVNWGSGPPIQFPVAQLLQYTNSTRLDWSIALLNVAIACESLHVLVFSNDFWSKDGSIYKGLPLVDTEHLLELIEPGDTKETRYTTVVDSKQYRVVISLDRDAQIVQSGSQPPPTPDLVLVCMETELAQAFAISVNLVSEKDTIPGVWKGYVNAGGERRKRFASMVF